MTKRELSDIIHDAFQMARESPDIGDSSRDINQNRSKVWIESLAIKFRDFYNDPDSSVLVFSKDYDGNRDYLSLNELLYDVCVFRVGLVQSSKHKKDLYYVKEALWQVESEFSNSSKDALIDFNKLVLGSAENKLFFGQQVGDIESFINVLKEPASVCLGEVFLCLLPHPKEWQSDLLLLLGS